MKENPQKRRVGTKIGRLRQEFWGPLTLGLLHEPLWFGDPLRPYRFGNKCQFYS